MGHRSVYLVNQVVLPRCQMAVPSRGASRTSVVIERVLAVETAAPVFNRLAEKQVLPSDRPAVAGGGSRSLNRHMDGRDRVKCEVDFPPLTGRELDRFSGFGASRIRIPGQRENIVQRTLRVMEQLEMVPGHSPDSDVIHARRQVNKFILSSL